MGMDERTMRRMLFHEISFYPFAGFLWGLAESTAVLLPLALSYDHLIHTGYIQIQHLAALLVCLGALAAALLTVTVCAVHFGWKKVRVRGRLAAVPCGMIIKSTFPVGRRT